MILVSHIRSSNWFVSTGFLEQYSAYMLLSLRYMSNQFLLTYVSHQVSRYVIVYVLYLRYITWLQTNFVRHVYIYTHIYVTSASSFRDILYKIKSVSTLHIRSSSSKTLVGRGATLVCSVQFFFGIPSPVILSKRLIQFNLYFCFFVLFFTDFCVLF